MEWCIYRHINKINGKSYIGQTMQYVKNRWGIEGRNYKRHNLYFWNAINKNGWDNFEHVILEEHIPSKDLANEREKYYINLYRTYIGFDDSNGYNMTLGGDNRQNLGNSVYQIDMKTLKPINEFPSVRLAERETAIRRTLIMQSCDKNSPSISGGGYYWCYKKDYSKDWKPKQKKDRHDNPLNKEVYQIDMKTLRIIKKFKSLGEISRFFNCRMSRITSCCQRKAYKCKNYFWCFVKDYTSDWQPIKTNKDARYKKCVRISINNLKEIEIYNSLKEASNKNNISISQIAACCKGRHHSTGNFYWVYLENYNENWKPSNDREPVKFICVETQKIYNSFKLAEKETHCKANYIQRVCKGDRLSCNGLHWAYLENYTENYKIHRRRKERKYLCVETNEIFNYSTEAARKYGVDSSSILKCCKDPKRTCGHFHWRIIKE